MAQPDLIQAQLKTAQIDHFFNDVVILIPVETTDAVGQVKVTYNDGSTIQAGVDLRPGSENRQAEREPLTWDATLRVAHGTGLTRSSKVRLIKRYGSTLETPLVFEIVSPAQDGPSAVQFRLKRVEL